MRRRSLSIGIVIVAVLAAAGLGLRIVLVVGESMAPSLRSGDVAVTVAATAIDAQRGSILLVARHDPDRTLLLHRVVEHGVGWRLLRGDASRSVDAERFTDADVRGRLVAVIPLSAIPPLAAVLRRFTAWTAATFAAQRSLSLSVAAAAGASVALEGVSISGGSAAGELLPGATATWSLLLRPCSATSGSLCGPSQSLRIDPDRFSPLAGTPGLARALRLAARCQDPDGAAWREAGDLFTAEWSAALPSTGLLVPGLATATRCELRATLLGALDAQAASLTLPLLWGP